MRIFFIFLLISQPLVAQSNTLKKVLGNLEKTYRETQDFQVDFEQVEIHGLLKKEKKTTGTIYSLPEGKIFWHTQTSPSFKVISDGTTIWLYTPQDGQLFTETWGNLDSQTKMVLLFFRREGNLEKHFRVSWQNRKQKILLLRPKKTMMVDKIFLFLSSDKNVFLQKIIFFYPLQRKTELTLKDIKFNQNLLERHKETPLDENINKDFQFSVSKNR